MEQQKKRHVKKTWLAIAISLIAGFEGVRQYAYKDPVGIPTICFGYIQGVEMGDFKSLPECKELLSKETKKYADAVYKSVKIKLSHQEYIAYTSFTYNVGIGNFNKSTLLKLVNKGKRKEACEQLTRWVYAKGIKLKGLINRRKQERELCLSGLD